MTAVASLVVTRLTRAVPHHAFHSNPQPSRGSSLSSSCARICPTLARTRGRVDSLLRPTGAALCSAA